MLARVRPVRQVRQVRSMAEGLFGNPMEALLGPGTCRNGRKLRTRRNRTGRTGRTCRTWGIGPQ